MAIVSHKHKLIFLKPRKVAGTSFEMAFSAVSGRKDVITRISPKDERERRRAGLATFQNCGKPVREIFRDHTINDVAQLCTFNWPAKYYNHMSASMLRDCVGGEVWDTYRKISIVRNPWDLLVSKYFWSHRGAGNLPGFGNWLRSNAGALSSNRQQYFIGEDMVVDRFLRFERLESDIEELEQAIPSLDGLAKSFSGFKAKADSRPESSRDIVAFYRDEGVEEVNTLISFFFKFEVASFGYRLE
jgi:hypothetical protein